jgi:hypothetical protein
MVVAPAGRRDGPAVGVHDGAGPVSELHGANRFVVDLVEAARDRGYHIVALDLRMTRDHQPMIRVSTDFGPPTEIEISTEYGLNLEELIGRLPRPEPMT